MYWTLLVFFSLLGLSSADSELNCDNATLHLVPDCRFGCPPERTCQNLHGPEPPCVPPSGPCKPQCVCADGYAKNQYGGTCVTYAQCDKCPGNNQYFACDGPYSETCQGSCHCTSGYERNSSNVCASTAPPPVDTHPLPPPPQQPIEKTAPPNQEPLNCTPKPELACDNVTKHQIPACTYGCPPELTCQNRNSPPYPCAPPSFPCTPKCICDNGYARNQPADGTCVTLDQCDKCPGENEYFECDGDYSEDCVGHCYCFSNHVRDVDDKCVYVDPASPPKVLEPPVEPQELNCANTNEAPGCVYPCPPERTCQTVHDPEPPCGASYPSTCTKKCVCRRGYVRIREDGPCVPVEQCGKIQRILLRVPLSPRAHVSDRPRPRAAVRAVLPLDLHEEVRLQERLCEDPGGRAVCSCRTMW